MARRFPFTAALAFAAIVSLLLFALGAVEGGPAARPGASDQLTVTVGEALAFTLSTDEVTPGDNVTLTIVQTSTDLGHTFTLSSVAGLTFSATNSTVDLLRFVHDHPALVNFTIPAGQTTYTTTFIAPPFGLYAYFCLVAGHFPAMYGLLGSGEHGSTAAPYDGPGAPVFIIGGTIAGLVVVALVLGFVIGRRRGSHDEMPPERLGYSETPGGPKPPGHG
jgi:plastocyanin